MEAVIWKYEPSHMWSSGMTEAVQTAILPQDIKMNNPNPNSSQKSVQGIIVPQYWFILKMFVLMDWKVSFFLFVLSNLPEYSSSSY